MCVSTPPKASKNLSLSLAQSMSGNFIQLTGAVRRNSGKCSGLEGRVKGDCKGAMKSLYIEEEEPKLRRTT